MQCFIVLEAACFVSKYTEFGFAFYMLAAVPLAPRFWGGGRFNMEQSNIANQRQRDRGPMKFGTTTWKYMEVMNDDTVVY